MQPKVPLKDNQPIEWSLKLLTKMGFMENPYQIFRSLKFERDRLWHFRRTSRPLVVPSRRLLRCWNHRKWTQLTLKRLKHMFSTLDQTSGHKIVLTSPSVTWCHRVWHPPGRRIGICVIILTKLTFSQNWAWPIVTFLVDLARDNYPI